MEGLSTNGIDDHDTKGLNLGDNAFRIVYSFIYIFFQLNILIKIRKNLGS